MRSPPHLPAERELRLYTRCPARAATTNESGAPASFLLRARATIPASLHPPAPIRPSGGLAGLAAPAGLLVSATLDFWQWLTLVGCALLVLGLSSAHVKRLPIFLSALLASALFASALYLPRRSVSCSDRSVLG
jgi:hypothetical protein